MATDGSASAASEIEVGSVYPKHRADINIFIYMCRVLLVWRGVRCGGWRVEGGLPVRGYGIGIGA